MQVFVTVIHQKWMLSIWKFPKLISSAGSSLKYLHLIFDIDQEKSALCNNSLSNPERQIKARNFKGKKIILDHQRSTKRAFSMGKIFVERFFCGKFPSPVQSNFCWMCFKFPKYPGLRRKKNCSDLSWGSIVEGTSENTNQGKGSWGAEGVFNSLSWNVLLWTSSAKIKTWIFNEAELSTRKLCALVGFIRTKLQRFKWVLLGRNWTVLNS